MRTFEIQYVNNEGETLTTTVEVEDDLDEDDSALKPLKRIGLG